jgi:maltose/moltooligosaccharide transporter
MSNSKPRLSLWQIINMNVGFFGIQYSFGLQQTAINPLYSFLHAKADQLPYLNLAGPITGLMIQPLIGAISDRTWSPRWGRRKPFFLIGAIFCSLCLFAFPFSSALWMAAGLLWILDAANNTAMEPYRAFIADKLPEKQRALGFLTQSFFTGLGITLANLSLGFFKNIHALSGYAKTSDGKSGIPYWVFGSFFIGGICSIVSVLWSVFTTPEIPPTAEELAELKARKKGILEPLGEIFAAIGDMPSIMWRLALVYLFQWYAMFVYWQFVTLSIAKTIFHTTPPPPGKTNELFEQATVWAGKVNGVYNIATFCSAFLLVWLARRFSAKYVHIACLAMAGLVLLTFTHITDPYLLFAPMIGFGVAWASMMGVPYIMILSEIPKERYGVYMGIVNMMIVIPMILQGLTFGFIYKHFLGADPAHAITFAGVFLLIASIATMRIKKDRVTEDVVMPAVAGH